MTHNKPEIMSPAGYWPQLHAAIEAGADAVYFGLTHFTARAKVGFTLSELPEVMRTLHRRGVKGYITFNTLVFDHELAEAARALADIAAAGADSIIVQDVAVAQLARQIAPELAIHGSTQMSITSAEGINLAQQFGVSRVVLARELSLDEIRAIRAPRTANWRCLPTARCAFLTPGSAFHRRRGAGAAPIAANAPRRAVCRMS
jgi:U32 family peptidase